ncbi:MAG: NADH-ubiquinone oxidoreductase-F iron-sulfur binding region domain-containing protein [Halobacteria archaeon]
MAAATVLSPGPPAPEARALSPADAAFIRRQAGGLRSGDLLLLDLLHSLQERFGFLPRDALEALSAEARFPREQLFGTASFYANFRFSPPPRVVMKVCGSLSCHLAGCDAVRRAAEALGSGAEVRTVSCLGLCDEAPAMLLNGRPRGRVAPGGVARAVRRRDARAGPRLRGLADYRKAGGYRALARVRAEATPGAVIAALKESGLRGLGGAGFPAAAKWEAVLRAPGSPKYVVVNADEGEPGTFKDRFIMERDPHRLLEGALIAAATVGAAEVWVYLREEYARSRRVLGAAIRQATAAGLAAGPGPSPMKPRVRLAIGAGSYVCGEETALLESMEGRRGEPRLRPPFPATRGLWGKPTLVSNVETLSLVPGVLEHGEVAARLKLFSVSGDVVRPGIYEAPLGTTARELIFDLAGGPIPGTEVKAFVPGGVATGFLPASKLDVPLEFSALAKEGSGLGSGGFIVLSDRRCTVDAAHNCLRFFAHESCGKCTPCRAGTEKMAGLLDRLCRLEPVEFGHFDDLAAVMADGSICGLGQTAPAPVMSGLKHFREEWGAHLRGVCPAGVCGR